MITRLRLSAIRTQVKSSAMKNSVAKRLLIVLWLMLAAQGIVAQERRPIDAQHPLWFIHVDVWYKADPQKIIDLIPEDVRPYVCMNLSLSCQYDTEKNVYKMPSYAFQTYKSWGTVCQQNGMWFTCQPASGGHTHIQDDDMVTFEYFFKQFPNFLGWNYAEQFWGFDEAGDKSSSTQASRLALFAKLIPMHHQYGGFLTISFCGNIWSHALNPVGMMKRNSDLLKACEDYPEACLWLYKYTTSSCWYNNESVTIGPFISGLAKNFGVRYDNCGYNGALDALLGEGHGKKYPASAGIGTVMEQTCVNGGAVWDGPELTWREECFHEVSQTTVDGYRHRNWQHFPNFDGVWLDMFRQVINGTMYIPTREEVVGKTKVVVVNDETSGSDENRYATWGDLYDGLYKQTDPMNPGNGQWMNNYCYFKSTGRYGAVPMVIGLYDDVARQIPVQVSKSQRSKRWNTQAAKVNDFNSQYPEVSTGDLYVNRYRNQLVTYTPYSYLNEKTMAQAVIPLQYNTCETLGLQYDKLSSGLVREYEDHIDFYLNNYRSDSTALRTDIITISGADTEPTFTMNRHQVGSSTVSASASAAYNDGTYTLTVKHNGPVSLTVNCAGHADHSAVAAAEIPLQPLALPQQPALYRGEIIIEAEDMDFRSVKSCCTDPYNNYPDVTGHAANGFVDMGTNTNGSLRHHLYLKAGQEGDYVVGVRYCCSTAAGNITVSVNGQQQSVACSQTLQNEWRLVCFNATMTEGENTLVVTNSNGLPLYIDQVSYRPADVEPMKYGIEIRQAEGGTVSANVEEAAEGDTVKLTINADKDCSLNELRVVNSVFFTAGKTIPVTDQHMVSFVMPADNVTIEPLFTNSQALPSDGLSFDCLDLADVSTSMPEGWRCVQEGDEVHEYGNSYSLGARIMAGFSGYQGKALYWRNGCAEYGRQEQYPLLLQKGEYELTFAMAAWKGEPRYKVAILDAVTGNKVSVSSVYVAKPNADGSNTADVSQAERRVLSFSIEQAGRYVISFTDETTGGGYHEFLLLECSLETLAAECELTAGLYHVWDGCSAWAQVVETNGGATVNIGEECEAGATVYGDPNVYYTRYANLTGYDRLVVSGTPGVMLRVLLNRKEVGNGGGDSNGGALIELNPVIGSDGKAVVRLSDYEFVHLNVVKLGWGSPAGIVSSLTLVKYKDGDVNDDVTGDVNNDGEVGIADIVAVTNVMAGVITDEATIARADVNGDGQVGIADIVGITNIMAGKE